MAALPSHGNKDEKQNNQQDLEAKQHSNTRQPAVFVNHGGGPMPYMQFITKKMQNFGMMTIDQTSILESCQIMGNLIKKHKPSAILVVSAHWEESEPSVIGSEEPKLLYDYYGFPKETYNLNFGPKCETKLSQQLLNIFQKNGFKDANFVKNRGWDHGVFIPLLCSNVEDKHLPPIMQLSLLSNLDPETHVRMGTMLNYLRCEKNVLIVGSGMLFHNMNEMRSVGKLSSTTENKSKAFVDWLEGTFVDKNKGGVKNMVTNLINWGNQDKYKNFARYCHPREEHLLPLHVVFGSSFSPQEYQLIMAKNPSKDELTKIEAITNNFKVDSTRAVSFEATIATFVFH